MRSDIRIAIFLFATILFIGYGCQTDDEGLDVSMTYEAVIVAYGDDPLQTYDGNRSLLGRALDTQVVVFGSCISCPLGH